MKIFFATEISRFTVLSEFYVLLFMHGLHMLFCQFVYAVSKNTSLFACDTGQFVGSVISLPLSAVLCKYGFDGGWPSVFYVFGKND